MLVSDAMVSVLETAGTKYVFGVAGSTTVPLISAISRSTKLRFIAALHENASLGMADGYARASGGFGVVLLHTTPGLTTALPNLYNSFVDDVPLLVIVGDVNSKSLIREPALALSDLANVARTVTKWSSYAASPSDAMLAVRRALNVIHSSEQGPCCIIIPEDVLEQEFSGQVEKVRLEKTEVFPDPQKLEEVVGMIGSAIWPVILVGREVKSKEAVRALSKFCEDLAIPVLLESPYPSVYGVGFPQDHVCYMGMFRREAEVLKGCDLIVAIGGQMLTERKYSPDEPFKASTKIIHVHVNPWELGKNLRADLGLMASPERVALELARRIDRNLVGPKLKTRRMKRIQELRRKRMAERSKLFANHDDESSIKPWHLVQALKKVLDGKKYVVVDEGVVASSYLAELFQFTKAGSLIGRSAGCLGWGLGAAVGVKLAQPSKKVIAYLGDGALIFGPQALWTASHYGIPLSVVICNNHGYASVSLAFESFGRRTGRASKAEGCDISNPKVEMNLLCRALGAKCRSVTNVQELYSALKSAVSAEKGIEVVDVHIDQRQKGYELSVGAASAWT
jgi:benzoylformate decarboxylase